ncbi:MAG: pseudouridine synthase [Gammaproteobacteria bacterium]|nr:pseudouridine synthase [Gammaproteobacteria bacterium]
MKPRTRSAPSRKAGTPAGTPSKASAKPARTNKTKVAVVEPGERLQKVMARSGLGSRREIEQWITDGRVTVDRAPVQLGQRVRIGQEVALDGRQVRITATRPTIPQVFVLNKPAGTVCTRRDPERRPTAFELLPAAERNRLIAVGRLDFNTMGLLLFTDDGELAHRLMHPRYGIMREYAVRIFGEVDDAIVTRLGLGVEIDGERLAFDSVERQPGTGANAWFTCRLLTGRNREVRRLWESQGCTVSRLLRVKFGTVQLPRRLPVGRCEALSDAARTELYQAVNLDPAREAAPAVVPARGRRR